MKLNRLLLVAVVLLAACAPKADKAQPTIEVWKSPTCSCCSKWIDHLRREGFNVTAHNETAMNPLKTKLGVPDALASCHTGMADGYVIEGHVPAEDIRRLLHEKPKMLGLAVPGMPIGSPGMEQGDRQDSYETLAFTASGESSVYAKH